MSTVHMRNNGEHTGFIVSNTGAGVFTQTWVCPALPWVPALTWVWLTLVWVCLTLVSVCSTLPWVSPH